MRRWLRGTLRVVFLMALLGALNLYVLYYRRGTSVPELLRAAEVGRKATFMPGMEGPPGTPPKMAAKRPDLEGGLRPEYLRVVEVAVKQEEPLSDLLAAEGAKGRDGEALQKALGEGSDGNLLPEQHLVFYYDLEDRLQAVDKEGPEGGLRLERMQVGSAEHWTRTEQPGALSRRPVTVSLVLARDGALYEAVQKAGEGRPLGGLLRAVLAYDLDLPAAAQVGDRVKLVVEKLYRAGRFYRYGDILAAQYEQKDGPEGIVHALRHAAPGQAPAYYSSDGEDLRRAFLRSPLYLQRALAQRPVPHVEGKKILGTDYPVPAGTAVRALAAGKVVFRGLRGPLGPTLVLSHGGTEATYGRLGRFARGVGEGQGVRVGQILGYVGSGDKGKAAHLHFSLRHGGRLLDPQRPLPRGPQLPHGERQALSKVLGQLDTPTLASR